MSSLCRNGSAVFAGALACLALPALVHAHAEECAVTLIAELPAQEDRFGSAVALEGSDLAVGALGNDARGTDSGSVTTFRRTEGGWGPPEPLPLPGDLQPGDRFGFSIAMSSTPSGTVLAVGAPGRQGSSGVVYLFVKVNDGWLPDSGAPFGGGRLVANGVARGDRFGSSVALDGDTLVVGAPFDGDLGSLSGSAYVFRKVNGQWQQEGSKLTAPKGGPHAEFGFSVAIAGNTLAVGAPFADFETRRNLGKVYLFQRNGTFQRELTAEFREDDLRFGAAVALDSSTRVVGAPGDDVGAKNDAGSAYTFIQNQLDALPEPSELAERDGFGTAVSVLGDTLVVGAPRHDGRGAVFQYSRTNGIWSETAHKTGKDALPGDVFGSSVAIGEKEIVFGGPLDDIDGQSNAGSVAVCPIDGPPEPEPYCTKRGPASAAPGDLVEYKIRVGNRGSAPAVGVMLEDRAPELEFISASCGELPCSLDTLEPGDVEVEEVQVTFRVPADHEAPALIRNVATVLLDDEVAAECAAETSIVTDGRLTCDKRESARADGKITYTVTVRNEGLAEVQDVVLEDEAPAGLEFEGVGSPCPELPCNLGPIRPGESVPVEVSFRFSKGCSDRTSVINVAQVSGKGVPTKTCSIETFLLPEADLGVEVFAPESVVEEATFDLRVKVSNAGRSTAQKTKLSLDLQGAGSVTQIPGDCKEDGPGHFTCELGDMACGTERELNFKFQAPTCDDCDHPPITVDAGVTSETPDPDLSNNLDSDQIQVDCLCLAIDKTDSPDPVAPGGELTYTITVENVSSVDADGVSVKDVAPPELDEIQWCQEGKDCPPAPRGPLDTKIDLPANTSKVFRLRGIAPLTCGTLLNTASAEHPVAGKVEDIEETQVAGLSLLCQKIEGDFVEGSIVTYTFVLANCGPVAQLDNPGDEFTNTLPAGLTLFSASDDPPLSGTVATFGNTVTWNGMVPAGDTVTITIQATIGAGTAGTTICNQAAGSFDLDGNGANETVLLSDDPHTPGGPDPCCFPVLEEILPIPTLSDLAAVALALLLAALSLGRLRRPSAGR